jgi:hypothetical protein
MSSRAKGGALAQPGVEGPPGRDNGHDEIDLPTYTSFSAGRSLDSAFRFAPCFTRDDMTTPRAIVRESRASLRMTLIKNSTGEREVTSQPGSRMRAGELNIHAVLFGWLRAGVDPLFGELR